MADKKKKKKRDVEDDVSYMHVDLGATEPQRIDRLGLNDDEWVRTKQTAVEKGVFKFAHDSAAHHDFQQKKDQAKRETSAPKPYDASGIAPSGKMVLRKGESESDANWENRKLKDMFPDNVSEVEDVLNDDSADGRKMVQYKDLSGNTVTMRREDVPKIDQNKLQEQIGSGGGTTVQRAMKSFSELFKGATPKKDELSKALEGASNESADVAREKKLAISQKTESSEEEAPAKASKAMTQGLAQAFKNASIRDSAGQDTAETAREVPNIPMQPPLENRGPPIDVPAPAAAPGILSTSQPVDAMLGGRGGSQGPVPGPSLPRQAADYIGLTNPEAPAAPVAASPGVPAGIRGSFADLPPMGTNQLPAVAGSGGLPPAAPPDLSAGGPMSASASSSSKGMGGAPLPQLEDRRKAFEESHAAAEDARANMAILNAKVAQDEADSHREGLVRGQQMQIDARLADDAAMKHVAEKQAAYSKALTESQAPEKVDPNHWWNTRNTAQKIFAIVSAGLTKGATLPMFQAAINADVDAQQANIANTRQFNKDKTQGALNDFQLARASGLDEREARNFAVAQHWSNIEKTYKVAAMTAKAPAIIMAAQEQAALANSKHIEELQKMDAYQQTNAMEKKKLMLEEQVKRAQIAKLNRVGSAEPKKGKGLAPKQATDLADLERGKKALEKLAKDVGSPGFFKSMWRKATDGDLFGVDVVPWDSEAKGINAKTKLVIQLIAPGLGSGTLQRDDTKRWDDIMGRAGDLSQEKRIQMVLDDVKATLKARESTYQKAGYDMKGFEGGEPPTETMSDTDAFGMLEAQ